MKPEFEIPLLMAIGTTVIFWALGASWQLAAGMFVFLFIVGRIVAIRETHK